jgi:poly(3-hydroxyalkanoate) synthetase
MLRGEDMLAGFIAIQPENEIARQMQLLANLHDPVHVERYREFEDWFKHVQAIPGAFYLWIVEHLFRDNELIAGELEVAGARVELGRIGCPLNLLGGATDHITPAQQVFALADYVSTPPGEILCDTTAGGHLGLFMGHEALRRHWPALLAAVRARSG